MVHNSGIIPFSSFYTEEDGLSILRNYQWLIPKLPQYNIKYWIKKTYQLTEKYIKEKGKPDIIHVHFTMWGGYVAYLIKEKYEIPYIITEHHSIFSNKSEYSKTISKNGRYKITYQVVSNFYFFNKLNKIRRYLSPVIFLLS